MVQTAEGFPIAYEVFKGNVAEVSTLLPMVERVLERRLDGYQCRTCSFWCGLSDARMAVFQDYANSAIAGLAQGEVGYFQFGGDSYVVEDRSNSATTFTNGTDVIVMLTGLVNLSSAVFSSSADTLLIA